MTTREMTENDAPPSYSLTEAGAWADGYNKCRERVDAEHAFAVRHIERLTAALEVYADPANWKLNGRLDPNSSRFNGVSTAEEALDSSARDCPAKELKAYELRSLGAERAHVERLTAELKPFADCVFNDNGDMTVTKVKGLREDLKSSTNTQRDSQ